MAEGEDIILHHLRAIRAGMADLRDQDREIITRLGLLETGLAKVPAPCRAGSRFRSSAPTRRASQRKA
jgi:hypothetical protein